MTRRVTAPRVGEPIRYSFLKRVTDNQNELLEYAAPPRDLNGGDTNTDGTDGKRGETGKRGKRGPQGAQGDPGKSLELFERWRETSRSTSTVRIESESDSSVFVDVERIDRITFSRPNGGSITLYLDND